MALWRKTSELFANQGKKLSDSWCIGSESGDASGVGEALNSGVRVEM